MVRREQFPCQKQGLKILVRETVMCAESSYLLVHYKLTNSVSPATLCHQQDPNLLRPVRPGIYQKIVPLHILYHTDS